MGGKSTRIEAPLHRRFTVLVLLLLAACTGDGNPLSLPISALTTGFGSGSDARRGAVEVQVKSSFPGILDEIAAGGGPDLTRAMDHAGIPASDRPARIVQLQSDLPLYEVNPGALVVALMVYGS